MTPLEYIIARRANPADMLSTDKWGLVSLAVMSFVAFAVLVWGFVCGLLMFFSCLLVCCFVAFALHCFPVVEGDPGLAGPN